MPTSLPSPTLSALDSQDLADWERDGFHVARGLFSAAEVAAIRDRFDALAATGTPIPGHWEPSAEATDILGRYPRVMHPHELDPANMAVFLDPRVRALVATLMGEDVIGCQTMFYFKPPTARGQAFHQDNYYLLVQPYTCIAAWLAVDRSYAENGGLQVCPATHVLDLECPDHADLSESFTDDFVAPPAGHDPVKLDLAPGDMLFFTGSVIHGSGPNTTTDHWRRSFISHYMPVSATHIGGWYLPHMYDFDGRPVTRESTAWGGPCGVEERGTFH
ncbi:MAG: Phytanoyl-CoA dioxygenase, peroxisomal precursor [uncultured Friedmanniella sp.]|uniref:Phytanoyl-CoA dioxygenase, peroxisomal n=1 Tax=uncultured Friedmanniella sp. TaxID=335381 RepID=A0A6J4KHR3_9ACTN|nr:phytanoyl-CoA dioxygenase family protein [uncultured Friedmanniella sp.]CAA9306312.1 MAG: Phytanoyl-CoA dioxygenase, peroxisomal precursor [uncultured Friedmanniella sp.]